MDLLPIQNKIYTIRGVKVMFDFDLAARYGIETRILKQAVRRNIKRFDGDDFMFEVTADELSRSQIVTLNKGRGGNIKYAPFAFTELGVAMLSSVLNSETAIEVNRNIMRAFVAMRHFVSERPVDDVVLKSEFIELKSYMEDVLTVQNDINEDTRMQLDLINEALAELQVKGKAFKPLKNQIGFNSPQYDN